jgi:hypothetical protein
MNYPVDGLRRSYFDRKESVSNVDDNDLSEIGYSPEEIAGIKGRPQ